MINITQGGWHWDQLDSQAETPQPSVWHSPAERVSELLGPDGEPLMVQYPRRAIRFDLRPKGEREQA